MTNTNQVREIPGFVEFKLPETQQLGRAFVYNDGDTNQLCFYCDGFERIFPLEVATGAFVSVSVEEAKGWMAKLGLEWQEKPEMAEEAWQIYRALDTLPPFLEGQMQFWPSCGGIDDEGALRLSAEDLSPGGLLNGS